MIRLATFEDHGAVLDLATKLATSFEISESGFTNALKTILESPNMALFVADAEPGIVGYALATCHPCFYASGNVAWTDEIFVEPSERRSGIGRSLMRAIEDWASQNQCKLVSLATRRAAPFYTALGYADSATYFKKTINGEQGCADQPATAVESKQEGSGKPKSGSKPAAR